MKKIVITGTGRCGTSFLMHLFTELGLNTGYTPQEAQEAIEKIDGLNAGIEHGFDSARYHNSRIIKNPDFAHVEQISRINRTDGIDHVIIPIRKVTHTAASRAKMNKETHGQFGGFWLGSHTFEEQVHSHAVLIYSLIEWLAENDLPFTVIQFPRIIKDFAYLHKKIKPLFDIPYGTMEAKHKQIADYEKVRFQ